MSGFIGLAGSIVGGELNRLLFGSARFIGDIRPTITIEETHRDELRLTNHPVEQGAAITDHSFKEPPQVEMRIGWSDTGILNGPGYSKAMYNRLVALQNSRIPITVSTGKRLYQNMLITGISTETREGLENSAIVVARMRQIIIAQLTLTTVPPKEQQALPATSAPQTPNGTQQPVPVTAPPASILTRITSALTPAQQSATASANSAAGMQ